MARHQAYTIEFEEHPDYDHPFETNTAEGDIDVAYNYARKTYPDGEIVGHHIRWWDDEDESNPTLKESAPIPEETKH